MLMWLERKPFDTFLLLQPKENYPNHQLDIKAAFLYGELLEDVYVEQPKVFQIKEPNKVYKLNKTLYGLKQGPGACKYNLDAYLFQAGFQRCPIEASLYIRMMGKI